MSDKTKTTSLQPIQQESDKIDQDPQESTEKNKEMKESCNTEQEKTLLRAIADAEAIRAQLKTISKQINEKITKLECTIKETMEQIKDLQEKRTSMLTEINKAIQIHKDECKKETDKLQETMRKHRLEISSLLEQKQELVQEIEKFKQTASRICHRTKVAKLNTIANNTKQHLNQISKRFSELTEEMS